MKKHYFALLLLLCFHDGYAAEGGHVSKELSELLGIMSLEERKDPDLSKLVEAIQHNNTSEVIDLLKEEKYKELLVTEFKDEKGKLSFPLYEIAKRGNANVVMPAMTALSDLGLEVDGEDFNFAPYCLAARDNYVPLLKVVFAANGPKAKIGKKEGVWIGCCDFTYKGVTPLGWAAKGKQKDLICTLLGMGANPDLKTGGKKMLPNSLRKDPKIKIALKKYYSNVEEFEKRLKAEQEKEELIKATDPEFAKFFEQVVKEHEGK